MKLAALFPLSQPASRQRKSHLTDGQTTLSLSGKCCRYKQPAMLAKLAAEGGDERSEGKQAFCFVFDDERNEAPRTQLVFSTGHKPVIRIAKDPGVFIDALALK